MAHVEHFVDPIATALDVTTSMPRPSTHVPMSPEYTQALASTHAATHVLTESGTTCSERAAKSSLHTEVTSGLPRVSTASLAAMREIRLVVTDILSAQIADLESSASIPNLTVAKEKEKRRSRSADLKAEQPKERDHVDALGNRRITHARTEHQRRRSRCATAEATIGYFYVEQTRVGPPKLATVARAEAWKDRVSCCSRSEVPVESEPLVSGISCSPGKTLRRKRVTVPALGFEAPPRRMTSFKEAAAHSASAYRATVSKNAPTNVVGQVDGRLMRTGRRPTTMTEKEVMNSLKAHPADSPTELAQCFRPSGFVEMAFDTFAMEDEGLDMTRFASFCFSHSVGAGKSPMEADVAEQIFRKVVPNGQSMMDLQHFRQALSIIAQWGPVSSFKKVGAKVAFTR